LGEAESGFAEIFQDISNTSSATAERLFSFHSNIIGSTQQGMLEETLEASVMMPFNKPNL